MPTLFHCLRSSTALPSLLSTTCASSRPTQSIVYHRKMYQRSAQLGSSDYGDAAYWDRRYRQQAGPFDWYQSYAGVAPLVTNYIPKLSRVLMVGCGNAAGPLAFETPLKIVLYPDPRLRAKNKRINVFDENLEKLVEEMFDVMYRTDGVGLSAPQVGVNVQLMVFNPEGERGKGEEIVLVNPKLYKHANKANVYMEGCLSFPQIEADVERPISVRIKAQNIKGKKFSIHLKEFPARIFQHEYDHLQAILFFERMTPEVLATIIPALEKLEEDYEKRTGLPSAERIRKKQG